MSGTSLDGLDMAYCHFWKNRERWQYTIAQAATIDYPESIFTALKHALNAHSQSLAELDIALGRWYGQQVRSFIDQHQLEVDLIASHGHTVFHQPHLGLTYQIGNGYEMYRLCGIPVVNNFRALDISLGGQGAPLVPVGDRLLFHDYDYCLNLGGIANISTSVDDQRLAFDICGVNIPLNFLAEKKGKRYDEAGQMAASGTLEEALFTKLNTLDYYQRPYPKSLGMEWIQANVLNLFDAFQDRPIENLMHTYAKHAAFQISKAIKTFPLSGGKKQLLITGGGAFHTFLIDQLKQFIPEMITAVIPTEQVIAYKEALVFAFLGVLRQRGEVNCLRSVTGASRDSSGGVLYKEGAVMSP